MSFLSLLSVKEDKIKDFDNGDKIGYFLGDFGCGLFFSFVSSYLMLFYTDVFGISAAAVGTMFIFARVWDAINDPIMGIIADKNKVSKYGKFRPYLVKFGVPMTLVGVLCFISIPGLPENLKLPYAYVTYILFGMLYTAVNIPYGSLASVMTQDGDQRTSLSTFRSVGAIAANLVLMFLVPALVFGGGKTAKPEGFVICAVLFAVISSFSFMMTFRLTRERVEHKVSKNKENNSIGKTLTGLLKNRAFIGITLASAVMMAAQLTTQGLNAYLYKDYFKRPDLISVAGMASMIPMFIVLPFIQKFVKAFGKKMTCVIGLTLSSIVYAILFATPQLDPIFYIAMITISGLGLGLMNVIIWAMVADAIDYQEYINGTRNEGTVYATYSLFRKLAQAASGGIAGISLGMLGYQSGASQQTDSVGEGIKNLLVGFNFTCMVITTLIIFFIYNLNKTRMAEMKAGLAERSKQNSN